MSNFENMNVTPEEYQQAAFLARDAGDEMLSRLEWMVIKPAQIVDVGCGAGEMAAALAARFPEAKVFAVDISAAMLAKAGANAAVHCVQEDACKLSFPDHSVDLLCANFLLPWVADMQACLREWRRVLAPNGLLMVNALGTGTRLPAALPQLIDMHDLGDALVVAGFADPVLDACDVTVRYRDSAKMYRELCASGFLAPSVILPENDLQLTLEIVQAHAFAPLTEPLFQADAEGAVRIPLSHLRKSLA
jgi:malonyl-CoA O-methyltransferase